MTFYREAYRFVPWRRISEDEGYEPALPENISCELLADFGSDHVSGQPDDALFLVGWPQGDPEPSGMRTVPKDLEKLLISGRAYPPALALARDVKFRKEARGWSKAEAVEQFTTALRAELDCQRDRRFFLAKALAGTSFSAYKTPGKYYWIVNYTPARKEPIWYVSSDYFVYTAPVTDFEVDISWLTERFLGNSGI